ncbi:2063_t:CDS:2, partial [Paraglomus occultum]
HMARERAAELGFTAGGVAWFTDLSATDSTLVLPIVIGVVGLVNGEVSSLLRPSNNSHRSKWSKYFIYFYRGMCVLSVPIAAQAPTAICVYWLTSSTYSLVQSIVFSIPSVRKKLNFPT